MALRETEKNAVELSSPSPDSGTPDLNQIQAAIEKLPEDQRKTLAKWLRVRAAEWAREARTAKIEVVDQRPFFRSPALLWTIASLAIFLVIEGAVFRLGWYNKYLEPNSSAGMVESYLHWLTRTPPGKVPEVLLVGDSRIAEGFSSRAADTLVGNRIHFWNFGMGGTTPRVWYYILRDADPTRRRFKAIVLAIDHYSDEDSLDVVSNRLIDLNFLIGRLRVTDCPDFASSMKTRDYQEKALAGCLFKGAALRRDVQEFLHNIPDRLKRSKDWRKNGLFYITDYGGREENLSGLSADFVNRTIAFPPGLDAQRHDSVKDMVMPSPAPQDGDTTRYRERWLGKIMDLYKNSPTKIIFLELPRAPLPKPEGREPATFLHLALKRPGVAALPSSTFRDLERPEFFVDGLHLNKTGRGLFSARIAETIPPLIGFQ